MNYGLSTELAKILRAKDLSKEIQACMARGKIIAGAGINNALLAGGIAGKTIINALENNDMSVLDQYEAGINRLLARPLMRSLEKRKTLDKYCTSNELLQKHLPELWVTFKQYWAQEGVEKTRI
ncbi:Dehydrogenase (flavoprotein) [Candidatus Methanomarinus sp.]|nr:Dehydrogenase (flavoprotein) [ANME-2 cluster archaeon]